MLDHEAETRPVDSLTDPLIEYQRRVRRAAIRIAYENDYCIEGLNRWLESVDLAPFRSGRCQFPGTATVTGYYRMAAPVLTLEEAGKRVKVRSTDPDVVIDDTFDQAVVALHDDRMVMAAHIIVGGTNLGPVATRWALNALELVDVNRRVFGIRDPLFDRSQVTTIALTDPPPGDPDADCWDGEEYDEE